MNSFETKLCAAISAAILCATGFPQTATTPDGGPAVFSSETRLVALSVTVQDKSGHLVTNLPRSAFQVYESGVPQPLKMFKREDVEISLGLVIDNSGSMREKLKQVSEAALDLVKDSNPRDEVFIVNFNDEVFLDADFTSDPVKLDHALGKIDARGGTAMRDGIKSSLDHLKKGAKRDKKVLLVVTDGNDNASTISLESLIKQAQNSGVMIYAIGLLSEEERGEARKAKQALDMLTEATGGNAFYPKGLEEVDRIAHLVAHDLRNQYSIAYSPTNQKLDGSYRPIKVVVTGPNRPIARTRSGYYATGNTTAMR